jgi:hypothetical protein
MSWSRWHGSGRVTLPASSTSDRGPRIVRSFARMRTALVRLGRHGMSIVIAGASVGCDPGPGDGGAPSATAASAAASAAATPMPSSAEPLPPPPADLDIAAQQKMLACAASAKSGPCGVLAAMGSCKPWSAEAPSGDGRWIGRGFEVDSKKTTEQVTVLRLRRAPTGEVGPGQLPARVAISMIGKDEGSAYGEADKAIRALERSDTPHKGNAALSHLKAMTQWSEVFATRTVGGHVYGLAHGGLFICEGPKRELLVVRRGSTRTGAGDGLYATLWAVTW